MEAQEWAEGGRDRLHEDVCSEDEEAEIGIFDTYEKENYDSK